MSCNVNSFVLFFLAGICCNFVKVPLTRFKYTHCCWLLFAQLCSVWGVRCAARLTVLRGPRAHLYILGVLWKKKYTLIFEITCTTYGGFSTCGLRNRPQWRVWPFARKEWAPLLYRILADFCQAIILSFIYITNTVLEASMNTCSPFQVLRSHFTLRNLDSSWNVMAHGDAREWKWRGNWQIEWVANTLHTTSKRGVSSITTADAHTSAASIRLNWRPRRFKWTVRFAERRNLLSARVPSCFKRSLPILRLRYHTGFQIKNHAITFDTTVWVFNGGTCFDLSVDRN